MHDYKKILRYYCEDKLSQRRIADTLHISRNTVSDIVVAYENSGVFFPTIKEMGNEDIEQLLFPEMVNDFTAYKVPDYELIHKELLKPGVTLGLLWQEYVTECKSVHKAFYHRSYFFEQYAKYVSKNKLTMHISHKPADKMMVDYDGKTLEVYDKYTGEASKAYIFVATLPFSMKSYVRACPSMEESEWIKCHIEAYKYFGGVTRLLVPDNLKQGVISHKKYEDPVLNKTYQEMAEYYDTAIVPARVKKPKDKAAVEGSVGDITNYIFGRLRNSKFFSFDDLNKTISSLTEKFNNAPFQKKDGSRQSVFENEEKDFLKPLPLTPFELATYIKARVNIDYHVSVDKMNYSVPYEYRNNSVEVRLTESKVDIYYKGKLIASHIRLKGRRNQYSTLEEHMPENHKLTLWNKERFRKWAIAIGENTYKVIDNLLNSYKVEEQAYKGCLSILKLNDKYGESRLEKACKLALEHLSNPRYKNIKMILESGQDIKVQQDKDDSNLYAFIRGADYYGKKD